MGLDMIAFACNDELPNNDFEMPENYTELCVWRKHPDLHGWMEKLYIDKNNIDSEADDYEFNCAQCVELTSQDLDYLEYDIQNNKLPKTTGCFFGESYNDKETIDKDLGFIEDARKNIAKGLKVYYTSWW
jgi:hypothetical protein